MRLNLSLSATFFALTPIPAFAQAVRTVEPIPVAYSLPIQTAQPVAAPASAKETSQWTPHYRLRSHALKWEIGFLALGAIDTIQTIHYLKKDGFREGNPLLGKHPSAGKLLAVRVGGSLVHFAVFEHMRNRNPKAALRFAQLSVGVQGSAVAFNARLLF